MASVRPVSVRFLFYSAPFRRPQKNRPLNHRFSPSESAPQKHPQAAAFHPPSRESHAYHLGRALFFKGRNPPIGKKPAKIATKLLFLFPQGTFWAQFFGAGVNFLFAKHGALSSSLVLCVCVRSVLCHFCVLSFA